MLGLVDEVRVTDIGSMLEVTPMLKNGRAAIRLHNTGQPPIIVNKIFMWPEGPERPDIRDLLSEKFLHVAPHTAQMVDLTDAVLSMETAAGQQTAAVWMVFELDPNCQRFPVRYELEVHDHRVTRFVEQYPVY